MAVILYVIINSVVLGIQLYDRVVSNNLELIYENNKDSVDKNSKPVYEEYKQNYSHEHLEFYKISLVMDTFVIVDMYIIIVIAFL